MCGSRYWVKGCVEVNRWPDVLGNRLDLLCHPDSSVEFHPHLRVNCWSSSQFTQPADSLQRRIYSFSSFIQPKACGFPQLPNSVHQLFWMPWIVEYPSKGSSCIKPWSSSVPLQNSSPSNPVKWHRTCHFSYQNIPMVSHFTQWKKAIVLTKAYKVIHQKQPLPPMIYALISYNCVSPPLCLDHASLLIGNAPWDPSACCALCL